MLLYLCVHPFLFRTSTTCTIIYRPPQNKWYASITVKCSSISRARGDGAIGIDLGVEKALTITDG